MKFLNVIIATLAVSAAAAKNCGEGFGKCKNDLCCSKHGYCGSTEEYCGAGCQSEFGKCHASPKKTTTKKVTKTTKKTTTKKVTKTTTKQSTVTTISTDGKCGSAYGVCPEGLCCSKYGYCGSTNEYCGVGCQSEFGTCGESKNTPTTTKSSKKTTTTTKKSAPTSGSKVPFKFYYQCKNKNQWALTFDDGPYKFDNDLLDLLKKYNVKATFFLNGDNVMDITSAKGEAIVKRMYNEGHIIGSHTWKHADLDELSASEIETQMVKLEDVLVKYIGKKPAFMRLPYGSGTGNSTVKKTLEKLGYTAGFMWNVDTKDWKYAGEHKYALDRFKEKIGQPILSLNHCFYSKITKETLLSLTEKEIKYMKEQGYTPVTADECIGLPAYH